MATAFRRYLVYAPARLPATPAPVVFVFPGYSASAEAAAFYYTHTRFERLAEHSGEGVDVDYVCRILDHRTRA